MSKATEIPTTESVRCRTDLPWSIVDAGDRAVHDIKSGLHALRSIVLDLAAAGQAGQADAVNFCVENIEAQMDGPVMQLVNWGKAAPVTRQSPAAAGGVVVENIATPGDLEGPVSRLEALTVIVRMAKMGEKQYGVEGEMVEQAWDYVLADLENLASDVREIANAVMDGRPASLPG